MKYKVVGQFVRTETVAIEAIIEATSHEEACDKFEKMDKNTELDGTMSLTLLPNETMSLNVLK